MRKAPETISGAFLFLGLAAESHKQAFFSPFITI
jgi:hypothetical protein